jgi:hypothetical protein
LQRGALDCPLGKGVSKDWKMSALDRKVGFSTGVFNGFFLFEEMQRTVTLTHQNASSVTTHSPGLTFCRSHLQSALLDQIEILSTVTVPPFPLLFFI